jgi:cobyrinic acid a,c-diamide synthase
LGAAGTVYRGHEFHYATTAREDHAAAAPLFHSRDAVGAEQGSQGLRRGGVMGSFIHLIATADETI